MPGSFCISIDLELAWGTWDKPSAEFHERCAEHEHTIVRTLLELFAKYEIRATWAVVGRLLELDAEIGRSGKYGSRVWYAPELVELIRRCPVPQDLGSHSYGHIYFEDTPREAIRADLAAARRVHASHGIPFVSFVFPRNQVAHIDLLREAGVKVFRSVDQGWHATIRKRLGRRAGRVAHLADHALPITPATVHPVVHDAIIELPSSMLLMSRNGIRGAIHPLVVIAKARRGLAATRLGGGTFHLWFHPSNFYYDMQRQFETLDKILAIASSMRTLGELDIRPMSDFAMSS